MLHEFAMPMQVRRRREAKCAIGSRETAAPVAGVPADTAAGPARGAPEAHIQTEAGGVANADSKV